MKNVNGLDLSLILNVLYSDNSILNIINIKIKNRHFQQLFSSINCKGQNLLIYSTFKIKCIGKFSKNSNLKTALFEPSYGK